MQIDITLQCFRSSVCPKKPNSIIQIGIYNWTSWKKLKGPVVESYPILDDSSFILMYVYFSKRHFCNNLPFYENSKLIRTKIKFDKIDSIIEGPKNFQTQ